MTTHDHLGFSISNSQLKGKILIPKYYNPEVSQRLNALNETHDLLVIGDLVKAGHIELSTGDEIGKMAYGTGKIPFVRTSDISNWEVKSDPKQGVSEEIHAQYASSQDVQAGDLLLVRDGTYLIGVCCLITESDLPLLYQSHLLKFRVASTSPISPQLLLALLNAPIVREQIRAKQFTADIIDTIGHRALELVLPIPKDAAHRESISQKVSAIVERRVELRERLRRIPFWVEGLLSGPEEQLVESDEVESTRHLGFMRAQSKIKPRLLIPRYYNPSIEARLELLAQTHDLVSLQELIDREILSWNTGVEVGKMAYGTGDIPFIRTSDISNWELKNDPKQNLSEEIYAEYETSCDARPGDLFVVRDGTYLVGTSCILTQYDGRLLFCGGLYKLRVEKRDELDPYLLLALLNAPIVRKQMRAKQFTRDVIDTLGKRLFEIVLPFPKDYDQQARIAEATREVVETRAGLRNKAREIALEIQGIATLDSDNREILAVL